jgi:hypothetical protein
VFSNGGGAREGKRAVGVLLVTWGPGAGYGGFPRGQNVLFRFSK